MNARCLWPLATDLGEGPLWHEREGRLYFTDLKQATLHAYTPASGLTQSWSLPEWLCWLLPHADGDGFVAGLRDGIARLWLEPTLRIEYRLRPYAGQAGIRLNDAKADADGAIWFGSMHNDDYSRNAGKLARLDPDGRWQVLDEGYHICNGPAVSRDGRRLYHTDTYLARTYVYAIQPDGTLGARALWRQFDSEQEGSPDGMTVDAEDCVWIAQWGGSRVCRYSPSGELLTTIPLAASQPASLAFGGEGYRTLFITTAREAMDAAALAAEPLAGGLFAVEPGVAGLPPYTCR
ncbi:SMP-30/gluconolactonase/LRE family protein [Chitinimonas naiadis]